MSFGAILKLAQWRKLFVVLNSSSVEILNNFESWKGVEFELQCLVKF
jgi:hypothetical protein